MNKEYFKKPPYKHIIEIETNSPNISDDTLLHTDLAAFFPNNRIKIRRIKNDLST